MQQTINHVAYTQQIARRFGLKRAITYGLAAWRTPVAMRAWRQFLDQHVVAEARDVLMLRALRPYMRQYFSPEQRRDLLREHLSVMAAHFISDSFTTYPGPLMATLNGKNDARYTLHIGLNTSKEGELAFSILEDSGHYLAHLAASIGRDALGQPVLWIGGLQGAKPPLGRDEIVRATRDLYGMRPKGAVMLLAQAFAAELGLTALRAPGNEGHISQRGFRAYRAKRKIYADYGQFWEELGATKIADEEYSIPVQPLVRDVADVKPNKRAEWKKRQVLAEALTAQAAAALAAIRKR